MKEENESSFSSFMTDSDLTDEDEKITKEQKIEEIEDIRS